MTFLSILKTLNKDLVGISNGSTKDSSGIDVLNWEYYRSLAFGGLYYQDTTGNQAETDSFKALVPNKTDRD